MSSFAVFKFRQMYFFLKPQALVWWVFDSQVLSVCLGKSLQAPPTCPRLCLRPTDINWQPSRWGFNISLTFCFAGMTLQPGRQVLTAIIWLDLNLCCELFYLPGGHICKFCLDFLRKTLLKGKLSVTRPDNEELCVGRLQSPRGTTVCCRSLLFLSDPHSF